MHLSSFFHTVKWFHSFLSNTNNFIQYLNKVECFQVLLCIIDNSIKHHLFVHTHLNDQTVLFQTIQFNIITQFKCQTLLFEAWIGPYQVLPLRARVDLEVMAMKGYSAFPKAPALLDLHYQIV